MVLVQYPKECEIKSVAPHNFPADTAAVLIYFHIFQQFSTNFTPPFPVP